MTRSTNSNGTAPGGGVALLFEKPFRPNSQAQRSSALPRPHTPSDHRLAAALRRDQQRRTAAAAQVAIRRRAVVALVLCLAGIVGTVLTVEREVRLQRVEAQQ